MIQPTALLSSFVKPGSEGLLSPLMTWLKDSHVSEVMMNAPREVFIERNGVISRHDVPELTPLYAQRLFQMIANESNQRLDDDNPLLSGNLYNGTRVQLIIPPVSKHHSFAIRQSSIEPMQLQDYEARGFYQGILPFDEYQPLNQEGELLALYLERQWGYFMQRAIEMRKNIVISGGTSSGKTTYLNACINAIDAKERIILLEDTRELTVPHANHVALLASKGGQGNAAIDMQTLLQATLRLRPDRIIMGEIRGREIMDFIMACSTGHEGSMTSIHANNPRMAMLRMVQLYKQNNVPSMRDEDIRAELDSVIDVILQVDKTHRGRVALSCYYKGAVSHGHIEAH